MKLSVAALIATYRRPRELQRLLESLAHVGGGLDAVVVVDNDGNEEVRTLVEKTYAGAHYLNPGTNLGCGGGLKLAEEYALPMKSAGLTHLLILDDDAGLAPRTVTAPAQALERERADPPHPLVP